MLCLSQLVDIQVEYLNRHLERTLEFRKEVRVGDKIWEVSSTIADTQVM